MVYRDMTCQGDGLSSTRDWKKVLPEILKICLLIDRKGGCMDIYERGRIPNPGDSVKVESFGDIETRNE